MHQQRPNQACNHHETHIAQHETPPGKLEHVEGGVHPEDSIGSAEIGGADPGQEGLGLADCNTTTQETSRDGGQQHERPGASVQVIAELKQQLGIQVRAADRRTQPVSQGQGTEQPCSHQQPEPEEQPCPGCQLRGEHR